MKNLPKISSLIDKAIFDYSLIEPNDKILIGASGGKDSTTLIKYFSERKRRINCHFEYLALNIQNDFSPPFPIQIIKLFEKWQVPFDSIKINTSERIKENQKMNCWWCSTQRRTELLNFAIKNGFNKIALGHHLDDVLETFFMNMINKSEISTMIPRLKYKNYPVTIIRPLFYVSENRLIDYSIKEEFRGFTCTCDFQENSTRKQARQIINLITNNDDKIKERILKSLKNVKLEYLP